MAHSDAAVTVQHFNQAVDLVTPVTQGLLDAEHYSDLVCIAGAKAEGASASHTQAFRRIPRLYLLTSPLSSPALQLYSGVWQDDKHPGKQQLHLSLIFQLTFVMHPEKEK